jgi:hypothetical protein
MLPVALKNYPKMWLKQEASLIIVIVHGGRN